MAEVKPQAADAEEVLCTDDEMLKAVRVLIKDGVEDMTMKSIRQKVAAFLELPENSFETKEYRKRIKSNVVKALEENMRVR